MRDLGHRKPIPHLKLIIHRHLSPELKSISRCWLSNCLQKQIGHWLDHWHHPSGWHLQEQVHNQHSWIFYLRRGVIQQFNHSIQRLHWFPEFHQYFGGGDVGKLVVSGGQFHQRQHCALLLRYLLPLRWIFWQLFEYQQNSSSDQHCHHLQLPFLPRNHHLRRQHFQCLHLCRHWQWRHSQVLCQSNHLPTRFSLYKSLLAVFHSQLHAVYHLWICSDQSRICI